jgi:hypothetical protein
MGVKWLEAKNSHNSPGNPMVDRTAETLNAGSTPATSTIQTKYDNSRIIYIQTIKYNNMSKIKSIYDLLQPKLKSELQDSARKYDSAKRLKYKLMSSTLWHDLSLRDISDLMSYSGLYTSDVTAKDIMYGGRMLIEE